MEDLRTYIEHPWPYQKGVELYEKYGSSLLLKRMFRATQDDYNEEKLLAELRIIFGQASTKEAAVRADYPEKLTNELSRAKELMDMRSDLKSQLRKSWRDGEPSNRRKDATMRILGIKAELDSIYSTEKYYKQMKSLPDDDLNDEDEIAKLMRRLGTVRTYVSKYKNNEKKLDKYEEYNSELFGITEKLKLLGVAI